MPETEAFSICSLRLKISKKPLYSLKKAFPPVFSELWSGVTIRDMTMKLGGLRELFGDPPNLKGFDHRTISGEMRLIRKVNIFRFLEKLNIYNVSFWKN